MLHDGDIVTISGMVDAEGNLIKYIVYEEMPEAVRIAALKRRIRERLGRTKPLPVDDATRAWWRHRRYVKRHFHCLACADTRISDFAFKENE